MGLGKSGAQQKSPFHLENHMEILGGHSSDSLESRDTYYGCYDASSRQPFYHLMSVM